MVEDAEPVWLGEQAEDMRSAGVMAGVDVLRARVQLAAEQQRLIAAENQAATRRLVPWQVEREI